jgi:hypothetical protein
MPEITYRRIAVPQQPFCSVWCGWRRNDDGTIAFAARIFSRETVKEMLSQYGREAVRRLFDHLKKEIATAIENREQILKSEVDQVQMNTPPVMTREDYARICGGRAVA